MLFSTLPQFVVLGLLLLGGLVLGLGLHPGGKKWKDRFDDESDNYAEFRREADGRLREANRRIAELEKQQAGFEEREARLRAQIAELEARPAPVLTMPVATPQPIPVPIPTLQPVVQPIIAEPAPAAGFAMPIAATAAVPAFAPPAPVETSVPVVSAEPEPDLEAPAETEVEPEEPKKGWFSMGGSDDLSRVRTIDDPLKDKLSSLGVTSFADIEKLSAEDEMALEQRLEIPAGFIAREQWRDQAALLRAGKVEEHRARFWAR